MRESTRNTWVQGLVAGLIGYATVVAVFGVGNAVAGRSFFYTAEALGVAILGGLPGAGAVIAFNGVHMIASVIFGTIAAWLIHETELHPRIWFVILFLFVTGFLLSSAAMGVLASEMADAAPWWAVFMANAAAAALAGGYLYTRHPWLTSQIRDVAEH